MTNEYAFGQFSSAFLTATTHENPDVRDRADRRARQWADALRAMADGRAVLGSRVPVDDLPEWVTLQVLRGGFTDGRALAETPLTPEEIALAGRVGVAADRRALLGYFLTDDGLAELFDLLDSRAYRVDLPEDAVLLTVAWLVRAGDRSGALDVLDAVAPRSDRLRLTPKRTAGAAGGPADIVHRSTAGAAAAALRGRRPRPQIAAHREALTV